MKKTCTLLAVTSLCVASVNAQTVSDNFNDNSRDATLWNDPFIEEGGGDLLEQNERVEFTAPGGFGSTDVSQAFKRYPTYNQAWQVQMVVSMSPANFSSPGEVGAVSIGIGSGNHWLGMGYGAGVLALGSPSGTALVSNWSVGAGEADNITPMVLPSAIGVRIAYDPQRRLIRTYYDLDADMTDGEWTPYDSFTIDGSPNPIGTVSLDWGMAPFDNFYVGIGGFSSGPAIAEGSAWADDFEFKAGQTLLTPTFADDFEDGVRDPVIWNDPVSDAGEALAESNERLEFTTTAGVDNWVVQSIKSSPTYDQAWQIQTLVWLDQSQFGTGQLGYMGIGIGSSSPGDKNVEIGMGVGNSPDIDLGTYREGIYTGGYDPILTEDNGYLSIFVEEDLVEAIGVRATYDPNTRIIRTYYDLDSDNSDGEWTLFESYYIDDPTVAEPKKGLDWGMTQSDTFYLEIYGGAEGTIAVASGTAWMDDFAFNRGSTLQSEPGLSLADDFNDDSRDVSWDQPTIGDGSPLLLDVSHRVEFQLPSPDALNNIEQGIGSGFWPRYDQAWEAKVETHFDPASWSGDGVGGSVALLIQNSADFSSEVRLLRGAVIEGGQLETAIFSEVSEQGADKGADGDFQAVPANAGLRMVWDPDSKVLTCYVDLDDDPSVESWQFFSSYTLDGSDQSNPIDFQMQPSDQFSIRIRAEADPDGGAGSAVVAPGEVYFDNFQLFNAPLLTGYEAWASAIPDQGMRGQTDDASGNGIPNLLQYMYGLDPLAADTDVKLRIQMESGFPVVYHGLNESTPDYYIWYELKDSLSDPWVSAVGDEATSMEIVQINGKTLSKLTFPTSTINNFVRLVILPY